MKTLIVSLMLVAGTASAATLNCTSTDTNLPSAYSASLNTETNEIALRIDGIERFRFYGDEVEKWDAAENSGAEVWYGSHGAASAMSITLDLRNPKYARVHYLSAGSFIGFPVECR